MHYTGVLVLISTAAAVKVIAQDHFKPSNLAYRNTESRGFWNNGWLGSISSFFAGKQNSPPNYRPPKNSPPSGFSHRRTLPQGHLHNRNSNEPLPKIRSPTNHYTLMKPPSFVPPIAQVSRSPNAIYKRQTPPLKPNMSTGLMQRFTSIKDNILRKIKPKQRGPQRRTSSIEQTNSAVPKTDLFVPSSFLPSPKEGNMAHDAFQPVFVPSISLDHGLPKESMKPMEAVERPKRKLQDLPKPELINFLR